MVFEQTLFCNMEDIKLRKTPEQVEFNPEDVGRHHSEALDFGCLWSDVGGRAMHQTGPNCQQHSTLTRGGQFARLQMPVVPDELIETNPQHLRGLSWGARNNNQPGASILMMNGGGGTDGILIIDSGAAVHASGNRYLFTEYGPVPPQKKLYAADRKEMPCAGYGSIKIASLGLELRDVYHVRSMGNKTLLSVAELNKLGYGVNFSGAGCSIRDERTWTRKLVGEGHLVDGQFVLDSLKISLNRAPVSDGTFTLLWRDVRMRWNRLTKLLQRDERLPR